MSIFIPDCRVFFIIRRTGHTLVPTLHLGTRYHECYSAWSSALSKKIKNSIPTLLEPENDNLLDRQPGQKKKRKRA